MSLLEYVLQNGNSLWDFTFTDIISVIAAVVSVIIAASLAIFAIWRYRLAKQTLSLDAFMETLDVFADEKAREARRQVFAFFPDYTEKDDSGEEGKKRAEGELKTSSFWIKSEDGLEKKPLQIKRLKIEGKSAEREVFEEVSVRADRIGFMFFNMELSRKFKGRYVDWLCVTFCDMWNRLAPHVSQRRELRKKFAPYFEKLAYLAYQFFKDENEKAKLLVLNEDLMRQGEKEYRKLKMDC